jgi:hypothetical protein
MKDLSFAEILENFSSENQLETPMNQEISSTLEPAFFSTLLCEAPYVRVQNHSASAYTRPVTKFVRAADFKLKASGMSHEQFKAYEKLFYALEIPVLTAHRLFPESFSLGQLKKAYKLAALRNHPDQGGSHESFLEIKKCYDILEGFVKTKAT